MNTNMTKKLAFMTPKESVKKLVSLYYFGQWTEIYKGEVVIVNEKFARVLEFSYNMVRCERPPVYKTIEEAMENKLGIVRHNT